ncbi:MAG: hypothetical protein K9L68_13545 [Spirochaetales bacterium]|nr:hypothetical protein [Spirochaetales bacterium]MCF7939616.1 hypothetical protein [Spirochaetales bacterium]
MKSTFIAPIFLALLVVLTATFAFVSCSTEPPMWTVSCKLSEPGSEQTAVYEFEWDPIQNQIVGYYTELEGYSNEADSIEEVRQAGYDPRPEGYLLTGRTKVIWKRDGSDGLVESPLIFQPTGRTEDALEGSVSTQLSIDGENMGPAATGEYQIKTAGTSKPAEYLAENSHTYLYWKAKQAAERGASQDAVELLEKALELKDGYQAARELKDRLE